MQPGLMAQMPNPNNSIDLSTISNDSVAGGPSEQVQGGEGKKKGNWFTHLLPTIGSMAVPALGMLLAPATGGTSLIAAAGLSGLGAAGGKLAQNAAEGNDLGDDVAAEGAMGAVGGGVGGMFGKALGKGASMLAGRAEKMGAEQAAEAGAKKAIDTAATTYKDVSPQLQKAYNAKDSLQHVTDMGYDVADPNNLVHVANSSNDVLNGLLDQALSKSGPVDMAHYPQVIRDAIARESGTLGSFDKVSLSRGRFSQANTKAAQLLSQLEDLGAGIAKPGSDPNELRTLTTKLGQLAQDAKPSVTAATGAVDPEQRAVYNVINEVRDNLKTSLYDRPEVNDTIKGMIGNLRPEDVGTPQLAEHLNDLITKAGHGDKSAAQDLLSAISRNINISNLGKEGLNAGQIVTSTGAKARAAGEAGLEAAGPALQGGSPSLDMAAGLMAGPHAGVLTTAAKGAAHAAQNPEILKTLSRIGDMGAKLAPVVGAGAATVPGLAAEPVPIASTVPGGMGGATMGDTMQPGQMQQQGNSYQDLINAMEAQAVLAPSMGGGASSFLASIAPQLQKNALLKSSLEGLPASFANAGGAQGTGGILSRISGLIPGTAAHTYQGQQQAAAQQLAGIMGISPEAAASLLPQIMQNGQTSDISQGILGNMTGQLAY